MPESEAKRSISLRSSARTRGGRARRGFPPVARRWTRRPEWRRRSDGAAPRLSANRASDCPRCLAIPASPCSRAVHPVGHQLVVEVARSAARATSAAGLSSQRFVSRPWASVVKPITPMPGAVELGDEITVDPTLQHRVRRLEYHQRAPSRCAIAAALAVFVAVHHRRQKVIPARSSSWPVIA